MKQNQKDEDTGKESIRASENFKNHLLSREILNEDNFIVSIQIMFCKFPFTIDIS